MLARGDSAVGLIRWMQLHALPLGVSFCVSLTSEGAYIKSPGSPMRGGENADFDLVFERVADAGVSSR